MDGRAADRVTGAILIAAAAVYALLARGYVVTFVADPLGPRAAPWLLAALLALLGTWMVLRPRAAASESPEATGARTRRTMPLDIAAFTGFAVLLPWTGFVLATALLTAALAKLADGPALRAGASGALFAGALYYVFVFALDVPLPIGRLFPFLGG